jgi:transmembrane 9 superfamily protein 2/4
MQKSLDWNRRWDLFFVNSDPKIHWYGIFNSVIVVGILSVVVGVIVLKTINRDIENYNDLDKVSLVVLEYLKVSRKGKTI